MITQQERRRLVEAYKYEPPYVAWLKCAVCLLIIAGLVVVGIAHEPTDQSLLQARRSNHHLDLAIGPTRGHLREAQVSPDQPALATVISIGPVDARDARPVVVEKTCPAEC